MMTFTLHKISIIDNTGFHKAFEINIRNALGIVAILTDRITL